MALPYATEAQLKQLVNKLESRLGKLEDKISLLTQTPTEEAASFMSELSQDAISQYLIDNSETIMSTFGITKDSPMEAIGTALYDKLQGGEIIQMDMNDGGVLKISGHFDEGGEDMWNMKIEYDVPTEGTDKCFPNGSGYKVKGGTVVLTANPAEITNTMEYDMALCIYGYTVDIKDVIISNGVKEYTLNISGLTKKTDWVKYSIVDPNGATLTISLHDFQLPEDDAKGTITVNGKAVGWKDVKALIK